MAKPYKLNLKRIIDNATAMEGKKVSISRAQMAEARRCIFAAVWEEMTDAADRGCTNMDQVALLLEQLTVDFRSARKRKHK